LSGIAFCQEKPPPLPKEAQERIKEFHRNAASDEPRVRAEQMERLGAVDFVEGTRLLLNQGLKDDEYSVRERATWALSQMKSPGPRALVMAGLKEGNERVRAGCAIAIAKMQPLPPGAIGEIAALIGDQKEDVQIAACEALGVIGSKEGVPALIQAAKGSRERVGVAAADALMLIKDPSAAPALIEMLNGGTWRTQIAAINALGVLRVKEAIWPLIAYLRDSEGRPREDAKDALIAITTQDFGVNAERWEKWWDGVKSDYTVPPPPQKQTDKVVDTTDRYGRTERAYHHMKIVSKKVLFVIDISASMLDPIRVKRGRTDPENKVTKASPKLDLAREELARVLRTLDENTTFNVIAFESDIRKFKKEAVSGTSGNVQEAIQWVEKQKPRTTGGSGAGRQSSGVDADGMIMGRTNTYGALKATYGLPHRPRKKGEGGTTGPGSTPKPGIDTVYFLTDGQPTEGETTNTAEILQDVQQWNRSARLVINTIGMSETAGLRDLLEGLARVTGGKCVFVGE
jgi:hypothetical protein